MARRTRRAWPGLAGPVALSLALFTTAACVVPPQVGKEYRQQKSVIRSPWAEQPAEPVKIESAALDRTGEPPPAPEPDPHIVRRIINDDPTQLMGLAPDAVNRLLGQPSLLRSEPPAQVWQYKKADCVLDIFLYVGETKPGNMRVTYYEIRGSKASYKGIRACFAAILESHMPETAAPPLSYGFTPRFYI